MGASLIYAPKLPSDPLSNLGLASLPDGELRNGAALGLPGLSPGAAAAALDGVNDYIETGWDTRTNLAKYGTAEAGIGWAAGSGAGETIASGFTEAWKYAGSKSFRFKFKASADNVAANLVCGRSTQLDITCEEGKTYTASIRYRIDQKSAARKCVAFINWYNAANALISQTVFAEILTTGEGRANAVVTAPAAATHCTIQVGHRANAAEGLLTGETFDGYADMGVLELGETVGRPDFPTTEQLTSGLAGWAGTAHQSEVDLGPFARGTQRTFVAIASRTNSEAEHTLVGSANSSSEPCLKLGAGGQDVIWSANSGTAVVTWAGAWPGNQRQVFCALSYDGVAKAASLTIDRTSQGSKATAPEFTSPGTMRLGVRNQGSAFWAGSMLPVAVFLRALSTEELEELYRKSISSTPVTTKPPIELDVELETRDGTLFRFDATSIKASNRPMGLSFNTQRGEGYGPGGFSVVRKAMRDYEDLNLLDKVRFIGKNGEVAYAGRVHDLARTNDPQQQISVTTVGPMAMAKFRRFSEIYIDSDLTRWGEASAQRRADLVLAGYSLAASVGVGAKSVDDAEQALVMDFSNVQTAAGRNMLGHAVYSSGGPEIAAVLYQLSVLAGPTGNPTWIDRVSTALNALFTEGFKAGTDLNASNGQGELLGESGSKFAAVSSYFGDGGGTQMTDLHAWLLKVIGTHGLPLQGTWPDVGLTVSDILAHIFTNFTPLTWAGGSTTYPVKHAAYRAAFPYDAAKTLNDLHLWELAVYGDEEVLFYPADLTKADWQIRTDDPGVRFNPLQGDSIDGFGNGVEVTFTDFTGEQHTIYPDENEELRDLSESNPANLHGVDLWKPFDCAHPTTEADAVQQGRAYLADQNRPKSPGTISIKGGYIKDGAGHWQQGWKPNAGETIALTNHPNDAPRLITSTPKWNQDSKELTISVDNGFELLEAFIAREKVAREAAGFR
jgi:hypothetical protein